MATRISSSVPVMVLSTTVRAKLSGDQHLSPWHWFTPQSQKTTSFPLHSGQKLTSALAKTPGGLKGLGTGDWGLGLGEEVSNALLAGQSPAERNLTPSSSSSLQPLAPRPLFYQSLIPNPL